MTERRSLITEASWAAWEVGPVLLTDWKENTTATDIRNLRRFAADAGSRNPSGIVFLSLVRTATGAKLEDDVRKELMDLLKDQLLNVRASAVVVPGGGLGMTVIRSLMTGAILLTRSPTPTRIFRTLVDAERWLREELTPKGLLLPPPGELVRAVAELVPGFAPEALAG